MKLRHFLALAGMLMLAGCTIVILPHPKTAADQTSLVYLAINSPVSPPPPKTPVATAPPEPHCPAYKPPTNEEMPDVPVIPMQDRGDHRKVEAVLVDYILHLRHYVHRLLGSNAMAYETYVTGCPRPQ